MIKCINFQTIFLLKNFFCIFIYFSLKVIPQLIARIDTHRQPVGEVIIQLLMDIGKHHPQALIYPLTVAAKSTVPSRNIAANKILCSMTKHSGLLVDQAKMVKIFHFFFSKNQFFFSFWNDYWYYWVVKSTLFVFNCFR